MYKLAKSVAIASLFQLVLFVASLSHFGAGEAATNALYYSQACRPDGTVQVNFFWYGNNPAATQQWLDLSLFDNGWQTGSFLGAGPLPASQTQLTWNGLIPNAVHYVRVNQLEPAGYWDPSPTFYFQTSNCGPAGIPAAPSNLMIQGPIADLSQAVPAGSGELGRVTVSWQDNSNNESGFRFYQDCNGTISPLFEVDANVTSYGPLQPCRPGRIGVAAFNAAGTSSITWSPSPAAPAAPSNLVIQGAIPDLTQMVPPGGGELGRITVSWTDNSNNEDGFRLYQQCAGVVSALFDLDANTNTYGPLQPCRPGRVGVAAFNAAGVSAILWSP